jgi:CHASE1-domain containing sensor protein
MRNRLMEPKFDDPAARMPDLGLSESEATLLTDHLMQERPLLERGRDAVLRLIPAPLRPEPLMYRHLLFSFGGGLVLGAAVLALPGVVRRLKGRRQPG